MEWSALLALGLLVGLDNLQVTAALGTAPLRPSRRWLLAGAFGACEGLMPLAGLALGHLLRRSAAPGLDAVAPLVLLICGAVIVIVALRGGDAGAVTNSRWLLFGLPLSLSFDNLFAGVALGTLGFPVVASALTVGAISAGMCLLGLYLGEGLRRAVERLLPRRVEVLSGVLLLTLAVVHLI
jgi:manganese efflux pump family protein